MKFGTIRQASFIFLCFSSLVSILIIQYFNLWILLNSTTTTKTTATTLNKTGREKVKVDNSNNNNNKLLYDKVVENSAEEDRIHEQKKSKSKLKREFSIKEIDEFSEKSELMKRMLTNETSSQLLNLSNLTFLIEPNQSVDCRSIDYSNNYQQEGLKLIIVVNSKWSNFERRRRVRDGWLNVDKINEQICQYQLNSLNHSGGELKKKWRLKKSGKLLFIRRVEYLFALGKPSPADEVNKLSSQRAELRHKLRNRAMKHDHEAADTAAHDDDANRLMMMIDAPILNESNEFKDLLVINLHEEYRSMSIKHLSIFKWLLKSHYNIQQHQSSQSSRNIKQQDKTSTGSMYDQIKKQLSYYEKRGQFKVVDEALNSTLVLKCDDDADINLAQLIEFYYQDRMNFVEKLSPLNELFIDDYELSSLTGDDDGSDNDNDKQISDNNVDSSSSSFIEKHDDDDDDQEDRKTATKVQRDLNWWIMCAKFPQDTKVYRHGSGSGQNKWQITRSEYHFDTYPAYCSGLAYLAPLSLLKRLFFLSHILLWDENSKNYSEPFWVDDVFITGILFSSLIESERARIVRLNAHFCYTRAHQSRRLKLNAPCMVSEVQ